MSNYIVGLDIGSQNIKAAVAELRKDGKPYLIRVFKSPSEGIRKGTIAEVGEATRSISHVLSEVKKISKSAIKNIYLGVGSHDSKVLFSKGVAAVSRANSEIYKDDIDRVIEASRAIKDINNRMMLHLITQEFIVDGVGDIRDPIGMIGNRLEVNSLIIDAFEPAIKNITRCVEIAGGDVAGLIFSPLASSRSVLTKNQKELGVVLIDIGFGKTSISVYEENKLLHTAIFPVGSGNVTNDLAIGVKSSIVAAEMIKFSFGSALAKDVPSREMIDFKKIDPAARGTVSRRFIAEIIEMRLAEIFEFVNNELKRIGRSGQLPAGAVLVGAGAKIPAIVDLAKQELGLSVQVGVPDVSGFNLGAELSVQIEDPEFACVVGLVGMGLDKTEVPAGQSFLPRNFFRNLLKYFMP
ncbi:MAG: cell division protein FtsA [Candidatus Harrisonbacteria bacterium RIFCSPLOWO2_02_FULL_41_13b]|uniref:Cell division protein FtsA n=1 Tax=Candidatus Harrisonbacteria bacterium RIFCSPLOWO2_02_FULL_41_13b TaxID=1798409 RepID=A0A1G1ZSP0_9BACT|nr:MAG: cell division protein FtsA [Candidatus Harrisonbacteria bacterium RIFCSPHIGHO2_02_FULL_40_20]OGY66847.1 MAG: cell division protein FtsA [Candidatus Harrisonbacteria bacterium RIFCSPLOWO2_02_FULL_41_13b]